MQPHPIPEQQAFSSWLARVGARRADGLEIEFKPEGGWGGYLHGDHAIEIGGEVLAVPAAILLDEHAALREPRLGDAIRAESKRHAGTKVDCLSQASDSAKRQRRSSEAITEANSIPVICLLLWERAKRDRSHVKQYIDMLPKQQSEMSLVGLEAFETELRGSALWAEWQKELRRADETRARIRSILTEAWPPSALRTEDLSGDASDAAVAEPLPDDASIDLARSWFWSRAITVPLDSQGMRLPLGRQHAAMVPLLDSLNHDMHARMDLCAMGKSVVLRAQERCTSARQVCINYGYLSSIQCLIRYGFLCPTNDATTASLCVDFSTDRSGATAETARTFVIDAVGNIPHGLLDFARTTLRQVGSTDGGGEGVSNNCVATQKQPAYVCGVLSSKSTGGADDEDVEEGDEASDDESKQARLRLLLLGSECEDGAAACQVCVDKDMGVVAVGRQHEALVLQTLVELVERSAGDVRTRSQAIQERSIAASASAASGSAAAATTSGVDASTTATGASGNIEHLNKIGAQVQTLCAHELRSLDGLIGNLRALASHLSPQVVGTDSIAGSSIAE